MDKKGSGVLLHISCLPSDFGIGDMGSGAYKFADFLAKSKQSFWQILPLNPTNSINGNSPYSSVSAFASNVILISPAFMAEDGLLVEEDIKTTPKFSPNRVDYDAVVNYKMKLFNKAYKRFKQINKKSAECKAQYDAFCTGHAYWLEDFAMFIAFKEHFKDKIWSEWPQAIRDRNKQAIEKLKDKLKEQIEKEKFLQYVFLKQWRRLKSYCNKKGIQIMGDIPIYVTYDSVDVWTNPSIFKLDQDKKPIYVAGVPPDYFSKTGQLWGNPVFNWDVLQKQAYAWWVKRIEHNLKLFDWVRIDHFRGFVDYWQVASGEKTAVNGVWQKAPAKDFFTTLLKHFPNLPIIAEDLGIITDEVREVMRYFGFPGMKVLLFAFSEDLSKHPYLPHNYIPNCAAYTGTHDNNTVRGWFEKEMLKDDKQRLFTYLGREVTVDELNWELIKLLMESVANMVIIPMQDLLNLGEEKRMNLPGTANNNWQWRVISEQINVPISKQLLNITKKSNRI